MRLSPFVVLLLVVFSVPGLVRDAFAREDRRLERLVSIAKSESEAKTKEECDEKVKELEDYLRDLHREGRLDRDLILSAKKEIYGNTWLWTLKRLPKKDVQRLLAQCVRLDEKVDRDTRRSFAWHLADVGQDCDDMEVFKQLEVEETDAIQAERPYAYRDEPWYDMLKPLDYKATLARAFVKSRPKRVTELAIAWATQWRKMGGSQAVVGGLGRQINRLLAACATEEAHAQVLENLMSFCLTGDLIDAFEILARAKYVPAYTHAKKIANGETNDETSEYPVRVAAVKMMASVQNEKNTQDIIATIDKIVNIGDLSPRFRKEIADLKRRCVSASVPGDGN